GGENLGGNATPPTGKKPPRVESVDDSQHDNDPNHPKPEVVSSGTLPKDKTLGDHARALQIRSAEKNPGKANPVEGQRPGEPTEPTASWRDALCGVRSWIYARQRTGRSPSLH